MGEISLKSTLGALSMVGSLALISAIEAALQPNNVVGHQWLQQQKEEYIYQMRPMHKKPGVIAGAIIMFLILTGGGLGWRSSRSRKRTQQQTDNEDREDRQGDRQEQENDVSDDSLVMV